jgi:protein involved in polysaccharide export with SLBB domain
VAAALLWAALAGPIGDVHAEIQYYDPSLESREKREPMPDLFPTVVPGAVDPDRYIVGPGDVFQLNLTGRVTRTLWLTVGPEGVLVVPGAGTVALDGLTLREARQALTRKVASEFRGVDVDLRLARVRTMRIFRTGEVKEPGASETPAVSRVSEVLPPGALTERASRRNIEIVRKRGGRLIGDLERFNRTGRDEYNPTLRDGDLVQVPVATRFISIEGAVGRPGGLELGPADSLHTLIEMAGGVIPAARGDACLLVRWKQSSQAESLYFSLEQVTSREFDPALRDGDHVYIYFQPRFHALEQASIFGEIQRPGTYPLVTGSTRLSDLVTAAGGFLPRANLAAIRLSRATMGAREADPELDRLLRLSRGDMSGAEYERLQTRLASRFEEFRLDWERILKVPELDLVLVAGDVVRVNPVVASVRVDGEVRRPGVVDFEDKRSVVEYVRLAGGYSERASSTGVLVTRGVTGQVLKARDVPAISPGDMIWVPARPERSIWQNIGTLIAVAAQVATIILVVRPVR